MTKITAIREQNSRRLSRDAWLAGALDILAAQGDAKLNIKNLSMMMGVSSGSFYWHFKNRDEFVQALLEYWHNHFTENVADSMQQAEGSASDRLMQLMLMLHREEAARFDLVIRSWAAHDAVVAEFVQRADEFRLRAVKSLFEELGFTGTELEMRTRTFVTFQSLEHGLWVREAPKDSLALLKARHAFFTKP